MVSATPDIDIEYPILVSTGNLQNVVLGMLAIFIPIVIGVLSYYFKKRAENDKSASLELYVMLEEVLLLRYFTIVTTLTLLLLIFVGNLFYQLIALLLVVIYIGWCFAVPLKRIWLWCLDEKFHFTIKFLKNIKIFKKSKNLINAWQIVWTNPIIRMENPAQLVLIYIEQASRLVVSKEKIIFYELLSPIMTLFKNEEELDEINFKNVIARYLFPKFLEWDRILYTHEKVGVDFQVPEEELNYFNWGFLRTHLMPDMLKFMLKTSHGSYLSLDLIHKHVQKHAGDEGYVSLVARSFYPAFIVAVGDLKDAHHIWESYFPEEWKLTLGNFQDKKNIMARECFDELISWSLKRVRGVDGYDWSLDSMLHGLLGKDIDPETFSYFILLLDPEFVHLPSFGMRKRGHSRFGRGVLSREDMFKEMEKVEKDREGNTYELMKIIVNEFKHPLFFRERMIAHKQELESDKIVTECQNNESKEYVRKKKLKLVQILIEIEELE